MLVSWPVVQVEAEVCKQEKQPLPQLQQSQAWEFRHADQDQYVQDQLEYSEAFHAARIETGCSNNLAYLILVVILCELV